MMLIQRLQHTIFYTDEKTGKVGIKLKNNIPAPMKSDVNETEIAVSNKNGSETHFSHTQKL